MPTTDQPTASDREADLQRICEEVGRDWWTGKFPTDGDPYTAYAKEVARRYAATVGAGVPEGLRLVPKEPTRQMCEAGARTLRNYIDWTNKGAYATDSAEAFMWDAMVRAAPPSPEPSPSEQE